jgi:hypothetical protein
MEKITSGIKKFSKINNLKKITKYKRNKTILYYFIFVFSEKKYY